MAGVPETLIARARPRPPRPGAPAPRRRRHVTAGLARAALAALVVATVAIPAWSAPAATAAATAATTAPATQSRPGPVLSPEDAADIARIERYLDSIRTMTARFLQSTSDGRFAEGKLYISRPGKLRIEYDPPVPILIVSDGTWIHYFDSELGQVNRLRVSETPASVLVRQRLGIGDTVRVTSFRRGAGTLRITLENIATPEAGRLSLTFADHPLMLRQWAVVDAQGIETKVALYDNRRDMPLAPTLFRFSQPRRTQVPFGP